MLLEFPNTSNIRFLRFHYSIRVTFINFQTNLSIFSLYIPITCIVTCPNLKLDSRCKIICKILISPSIIN